MFEAFSILKSKVQRGLTLINIREKNNGKYYKISEFQFAYT